MRADCHVLAGTHSPDMYALKSFSAMFKDSAVKFSMNDTAQHCNVTNTRAEHYKTLIVSRDITKVSQKRLYDVSYQIREIISSFTGHQSTGVAEPRDEIYIALETRGIGL